MAEADQGYAGAFRKRRWIAVGAAALVSFTVAVNDLPAQAATIKEEAVEAAGQTLVVSSDTFGPNSNRNDAYVITRYTPIQWPIAPTSDVSSGFGWRIAPCSWGCSSDHQGVDFDPGYGVSIHAIADGVVVESSSSGGLGQHIIVQHEIDGHMVQSVY